MTQRDVDWLRSFHTTADADEPEPVPEPESLDPWEALQARHAEEVARLAGALDDAEDAARHFARLADRNETRMWCAIGLAALVVAWAWYQVQP